ncbi:hypothetical protein BU202_06420 [Streptococcus cuniculi]|uniref:DUF4298 domain-containing protein n=1 Tax=Streptococcus cuniculi TaxID=1432788 RepID=A0A1Q8E775_9STRE|nr:DUF4298 domain-containing protein [Streptococcus cuniculi]OLF47662.1 hypothetical protein BU202_06420 [Streptococcus cuniculi]
MNDIKKIQEMEDILQQAEPVLTALEKSLEEFEDFLPSLKRLFAYYESSDWLRHYEMDEAGKIPQSISRGVLSQDAVYNLMVRYHELMQTMKELGKAEENN